MKIKQHLGFISMLVIAFTACQQKPAETDNFLENEIKNIEAQHTLQTDLIEKSGKILNPRTIDEKGNIVYVPIDDWTSGFFPGTMWLDAAQSLSTRFRPVAGVIQSWDADRGWQGERGWECPVIIDNMMNLELLFEATRLSGDSTFYNIAVSHANTTMKNHFRADNSCYHVIDYSLKDGSVRNRHTAQGYAHESAWARGQAWAVYGFTTCYRYTHDKRYLDQAEKTLNFYLNDKNLPKDLIPYWDFDAPEIPNEPRDVSTAACIASALYEMDGYCPGKNYKELADKILKNLSGPDYKAKVGENGNFILMHSVGSIPHGAEIDVPLNYADYYYEEALIRKRNIENNQPFSFVNE